MTEKIVYFVSSQPDEHGVVTRTWYLDGTIVEETDTRLIEALAEKGLRVEDLIAQ